jgi:hypothetical protein
MRNLIIEVTAADRIAIRSFYTSSLGENSIKDTDISTIQTAAMAAFNKVLSEKYPVLKNLTFSEMFTKEAIKAFKDCFKHELKTKGGFKKVFSMVFIFQKTPATIESDVIIAEDDVIIAEQDVITKIEDIVIETITIVDEPLKVVDEPKKVVNEPKKAKKAKKAKKVEKLDGFEGITQYDELVALWESLKADGKDIYSKLTNTPIIQIEEHKMDRITFSNKQFGMKGKTRLDVNSLHKSYKIGKVEDDVLIIDADKTKLLKNVTSYSEFIELIGTDCLTKNEELVCQFTQQEKFPQVFVEGRKKELRAFYTILGRYFEIK